MNTTHTYRNLTLMLALGAALILALAACGGDDEPETVTVIVTATPGEALATASATSAPPPTTLPTASATPTGAPTSAPTATPPPTIPPGVTYGPIVGPDHTLVPTETRVPPSVEPTVAPTAGPSPTPLPGLRRDLLGIQIHPYITQRDYDVMLEHASKLGVGWVKFQFNWSLLESAPGQYTELFYMLRLYVQSAHNKGFQVLVSVVKAPDWARTPDPDGVYRENGPPDDPQVLANFISALLNEYGTDVTGQPYISALEIWNEPNLQREWYGHPLTGAEYMRYFVPAYEVARAFSSKLTIITAAPAPTGDSQWSTNDRNWLRDLYNSGLAAYGSDVAVGIHPYGWANAPDARCCASSRGWDDKPQFFFLDTIEDYREIMVANGHGDAQMWSTEFGWATFDGLRTGFAASGPQPPDPPGAEYFGDIDQWQQAEYTLRAFALAQERPHLGPMILWNLNFATMTDAVDRGDPQTAYSLLDTLWDPRPVYERLQQAPKN